MAEPAAAPKVAFKTLGCRLNQAESEQALEALGARGFDLARAGETPDVVVINTCTVTPSRPPPRAADPQDGRGQPQATVVVTGCYAVADPEAVRAIPGVDLVVGNDDKDRLAELVTAVPSVRRLPLVVRPAPTERLRTRVAIKAQTGCDEWCTFCIIPRTRGPLRSYARQIVDDVRRQVAAGVREVVLTGVHLGKYGDDRGEHDALARLVDRLTAVDDCCAYACPASAAGAGDPALVARVRDDPKVCRHLPSRPATTRSGGHAPPLPHRRFLDRVEAGQGRDPRPGPVHRRDRRLPGETREQFAATMAVVERVGFSKLHVFPPQRPDTPAATMPDQVGDAEKKARARELIALGNELRRRYEDHVGRPISVLVESAGDGLAEGTSDNYIKVRFPGGPELVDRVVTVREHAPTPRHGGRSRDRRGACSARSWPGPSRRRWCWTATTCSPSATSTPRRRPTSWSSPRSTWPAWRRSRTARELLASLVAAANEVARRTAWPAPGGWSPTSAGPPASPSTTCTCTCWAAAAFTWPPIAAGTTAPYGAWPSPINAELVAAGGVSLDEVRVAGAAVLLGRGPPLEGGRQVVRRAAPGRPAEDLVREGFNARTRVHEYGGGSYAVAGETLFFSDFADQRLYRQTGPPRARPITPEPPAPAAHRYADACPTPDGRLLVCVPRTPPRRPGRQRAGRRARRRRRRAGRAGRGAGLLRQPPHQPRRPPAGWLEWDHPNMPWDGTELRLAELAGDALAGDPVTVAGGPEESVFQPEWSPDEVLHLVRPRRLVEPVPGRPQRTCWRRSARPRRSSATPSGSSAWRPTRSCPAAGSPASTAAAPCNLGILDAGGQGTRGPRCIPGRPGPALHLLLPAAPAGGRRPAGLHRRQPGDRLRRWS